MRTMLAVVATLAIALSASAQDMTLSQLLAPGEDWKPVDLKVGIIAGLTADGKGDVYIADAKNRKIVRIDRDGRITDFASTEGEVTFLRAGANGGFYASETLRKNHEDEFRVIWFDADGKSNVMLKNLRLLAVTALGKAYCGGSADDDDAGLWLLDGKQKKRLRRKDEIFVINMVLSPDQGTMIVNAGDDHLLAYRVEADGDLTCGQPYFRMLRPPQGDIPYQVDDLAVDRAGRVYAATKIGVQIFDPTGRLCGTLRPPAPIEKIKRQQDDYTDRQAVTFGGPDFDCLYLSINDKLFVRKMQAKGVVPPK